MQGCAERLNGDKFGFDGGEEKIEELIDSSLLSVVFAELKLKTF